MRDEAEETEGRGARDGAAGPALRAALERLARRPMKPRPDNFTPRWRTPWGGTRIVGELKAGLPGLGSAAGVVGESWEISDDPAFPSRFRVNAGGRRATVSLDEVLRRCPAEVLGGETARASDGRLPLLVKLIDAADDLSVQVHPALDWAGLAPGESGKSEAWVVLAATPGAGLYLGLPGELDRGSLAGALAASRPLSLPFVQVRPGDVFRIPPGTVHAIGRGCTLLEIQRFSPPRSGVTYRLWDWGRRYDADGRPDPDGQSRPLHVEQALAVADFESPRGTEGVERLRCRPHVLRAVGGSSEVALVRSSDGLALDRLRIVPGAPLPLATRGSFVALTCVRGRLLLREPSGDTPRALRAGESALIPAALGRVELVADGLAEVYATSLRPPGRGR